MIVRLILNAMFLCCMPTISETLVDRL